MIPYGKQDINQKDIDAVVEVLKSDFITQGPKVLEFEQTIASLCNVKHAVAVNSATSALHIACLALGVGQGDIVWTTPISFVASSNCALYCGANVDFVDIDITSGNMSVACLSDKLELAQKNNALPKIIITVHLAGNSCEMEKIGALAKQYNVAVIEDASHAVGASYKNSKVGSCLYSDITILSFHPVKVITSAEGGMALTKSHELDKKMRLYRSHGVTNDQAQMTEQSHGPWYYQQITLGFNYRMTELQAALGVSQTHRLANFVEKRNELAQVYDQAFENCSLTSLIPADDCYSAYHLYIVLLSSQNKAQHKQVITSLRDKGIFAHVHYIPIHLQPFYQELGFKKGDFPVAEDYYSRAISLPLHPQLSDDEQQYVIDTVLEVTA